MRDDGYYNMRSSKDSFYESLKNTPLAKPQNADALPEVAIWFDIGGNTSCSALMKIFKAIEKNFRRDVDVLDNDHIIANIKNIQQHMTNSGPTSAMPRMRPFFPTLGGLMNFSDNALYWIFKVFSETDALDKAMLSTRFINYAKKAQEDYKKKSITYMKIGSIRRRVVSRREQDLFEMFAELNDIIEKKLNACH